MTRLERTAAETKATRIASFRHYALNLADFADHMQARGVDSAVGPARMAAKLANETANAYEHNDLEAARQARADYVAQLGRSANAGLDLRGIAA